MRTKEKSNRRRPSKAELAAMNRFIDAVNAGHNPGVERFLRQYPEFADSLRPALEGMVWLSRESRRFHRRFPDADLEELFHIPRPV